MRVEYCQNSRGVETQPFRPRTGARDPPPLASAQQRRRWAAPRGTRRKNHTPLGLGGSCPLVALSAAKPGPHPAALPGIVSGFRIGFALTLLGS
jgi:hypothetical protein